MIYLEDIHKYDTTYMIRKNYEEAMNFFESVAADMGVLGTHMRNLQQFGIFTEDAKEGFLGSAKEAVRKLGQRILEIIERIQLFIKDRIAGWKQYLWEHKSKEQKLREIERKYPKEVADIKIQLDRGMLDFATFKDLNDFYSQIDTILDDINRGKIDPKSFRGRWEAIKRKTVENKDFVEIVAKTLIPCAISGITCYITYKKWKDSHTESRIQKEVEDTQATFKLARTKLETAVRAINNLRNSPDITTQNDAVDTATLLGMISAQMEVITNRTIGGLTTADIGIRERFFDQAVNLREQLVVAANAVGHQLNDLRAISNEIG